MPVIAHTGRLPRREIEARELSANRLALDLGVPSGRITDILNGRRSISADTAVRLGRYFGNSAQFWLDLQSRYDIAVVERDRGKDIAKRVHPNLGEAERSAKSIARDLGGVEVRSLGRDGKWRDADSVAPARNPHSPRVKKR